MIKILNIVGARPNFMKIAPLIREMSRIQSIKQVLVHTGQHYDEKMNKIFFDQLEIPRPDVNLGIGSGERNEQIARIMEAFERVARDEAPDLVLVVGDVNSTVACARIAKKLGIKVAHVEAGLRSFDPTMPEELNRKETDKLSDFLFVTEQSGMENLAKEQATGKRFMVGNVMIDTLRSHLVKSEASRILSDLGLTKRKYLVATFHRPSNVDSRESLLRIFDVIEGACARLKVVFPLHPRTRSAIQRHNLESRLENIENLVVTEPLGYLDFLRLLANSTGALTDSGGLQEETTFLRIPCITMRENTERPITVIEGTNVLVGLDIDRIRNEIGMIMDGKQKTGNIPALWDGHAAQRIVGIIADEFGT